MASNTSAPAPPSEFSIDGLLKEIGITNISTNEEWAKQIAETQSAVVISEEKRELPKDVAGLAQTIDHTLLKLDATEAQIDTICEEAKKDGFKSVCVRLNYVPRSIANLKGTNVLVACVVGFHEGTQDTLSKIAEASSAVNSGAAELDVVINWPALQQGEYSSIFTELAAIRAQCPAPTTIKLILETSQLSKEQIIAGSHLAHAAGLDFIKTSTGFCGRGASLEDVLLMRSTAEYLAKSTDVGSKTPMSVKASGGVRNYADAMRMVQAGASRIGASAGVAIVQEGKKAEQEGTWAKNIPSGTGQDSSKSAY